MDIWRIILIGCSVLLAILFTINLFLIIMFNARAKSAREGLVAQEKAIKEIQKGMQDFYQLPR